MPHRATQFAHVFEKLAQRDAEGFLRAAAHALVDPAVDSLIDGIRGQAPPSPTRDSLPGGPSTEVKALPPMEAALPTPGSTTNDTDTLIQIELLEAENRQLLARIEEIRSANRGLAATIADLTRRLEVAAKQPEVNHEIREPRETKRERAKALALDRALDYEDAPVAGTRQSAIPDGLIDAAGIAKLIGCSKPMVRVHAKKTGFPQVAAKLGQFRTWYWQRSEIDTWRANRPPKGRPGRQPRPSPPAEGDYLDSRQVAEKLGITLGVFYQRISLKQFPKHTRVMGHSQLWAQADVDTWIKAHQANSKSGTAQTCSTCADQATVGRRTICRSDSSPHKNTSRQPGETCDWHRTPNSAAYRPPTPDQNDD